MEIGDDGNDELKKVFQKDIEHMSRAKRTLETEAIVWWLIGRCITLALNLPEKTSELIRAQRTNLQCIRDTIIAMLTPSILAISLEAEVKEAAKMLERGVEEL